MNMDTLLNTNIDSPVHDVFGIADKMLCSVCVYVCSVCACMCMCERRSMCVCVYVCVCANMCVSDSVCVMG